MASSPRSSSGRRRTPPRLDAGTGPPGRLARFSDEPASGSVPTEWPAEDWLRWWPRDGAIDYAFPGPFDEGTVTDEASGPEGSMWVVLLQSSQRHPTRWSRACTSSIRRPQRPACRRSGPLAGGARPAAAPTLRDQAAGWLGTCVPRGPKGLVPTSSPRSSQSGIVGMPLSTASVPPGTDGSSTTP